MVWSIVQKFDILSLEKLQLRQLSTRWHYLKFDIVSRRVPIESKDRYFHPICRRVPALISDSEFQGQLLSWLNGFGQVIHGSERSQGTLWLFWSPNLWSGSKQGSAICSNCALTLAGTTTYFYQCWSDICCHFSIRSPSSRAVALVYYVSMFSL